MNRTITLTALITLSLLAGLTAAPPVIAAGSGYFLPAASFEAGSNPWTVVAADFNLDGHIDIAATLNGADSLAILTNDGNGNFSLYSTVATGSSPWGLATGDFDNDGDPDLVATCAAAAGVDVYLNSGDGTFGPGAWYATEASPWGVSVGDLDNDGYLDIAVDNRIGEGPISTISILWGNGDGSFVPADSALPASNDAMDVAIGDIDDDGLADLIAPTDNNRGICFLRNLGGRSFAEVVCSNYDEEPASVSIIDFNGDGHADVVAADEEDTTATVLFGDGTGLFPTYTSFKVGFRPIDALAADLNGDGCLDLIGACYIVSSVGIALNDCDGGTLPPVQYSVGAGARSLAIADFDGNGGLDIVTADGGTTTISMLLDDSPFPDSLIIPSVAEQPCDFDECLVQPIQTSLSSPMKGVAIPIGYGPEVTICSLSTAGLVTENWFRPIEEITDSAFFISLADQSGEVIDTGLTTVLNVFYQVDNPACTLDYVIRWDTTYMADPFRHLAFTDTLFATVEPGFDVARDSSTVLSYVPGDADHSGFGPDIADLVYLVNYMFNLGPDLCELHMDVTGDCNLDISDLVKLVNYMFNGGPALECGCSDPGNEVPKLVSNALIDLGVTYDGHMTTIALNSEYDLLGLQLELVGVGTGEPVSALEDGIELIAGRQGDHIKVGILDMEGAHAIASGASTLFTIDGEWEIVSALAADRSFNTIVPTIGAKVETTLPTTYALGQNYPNPFNPTTEIGFSLPQAADVRIEIYNTLGQRVAVLVDEHLGAGHHARVWDASTNASGVYFYRLVTEGYAETRKMMLLK